MSTVAASMPDPTRLKSTESPIVSSAASVMPISVTRRAESSRMARSTRRMRPGASAVKACSTPGGPFYDWSLDVVHSQLLQRSSLGSVTAFGLRRRKKAGLTRKEAV
jgi:hypothetical protein